MTEPLPTFGLKRADLVYRPRPGAYALVFDRAGRVALVNEDDGWYLPGGGLEGVELPEQALSREVREECACDVRITDVLGEALEFVDASSAGPIEVHARFFRAEFIGDSSAVWLAAEVACERAARRSHAWAIALART